MGYTFTTMINLAGTAMHDLRRVQYATAEQMTDTLVSKTNTQDRH